LVDYLSDRTQIEIHKTFDYFSAIPGQKLNDAHIKKLAFLQRDRKAGFLLNIP